MRARWSLPFFVGIGLTARGRADVGVAQLVQSAGGNEDRLARKADVRLVEDFPFAGPIVQISDVEDQEITGFGGAFTEAAALMYQSLPEDVKHQVLELYFGADGLGFTLGRVHINSCDFSPESWSEDDAGGDFGLERFDTSVTRDARAMIPFIKAARQKLQSATGRDLKLLAAPWSPPAWMKSNGRMDGKQLCPTWSGTQEVNCGWTRQWSCPGQPRGDEGVAGDDGSSGYHCCCELGLWKQLPVLKPEARAPWAKYFSKWVAAYKARGVPIWAVTPQNEPENAAKWEATLYTAREEMDWLGAHLGPRLAADHPEVKIFVYDHNKDHVYDWARALYEHPNASRYAAGVAFHWYAGDHFDRVARVHEDFPQAVLLASEATYERYRWTPGATPEAGDWAFGLGYVHDIMGDLRAGATGWIDWNLLLDMKGGPNHVDNVCDAAILTNSTSLHVHPQYYGLGHFSKYVLPGSRRLVAGVLNTAGYTGPERPYGTCTEADGLQAVAFLRPDGQIVVVALNCGDNVVEFKIKRGGSAMRTTIPPQSIQTYLFHRTELAVYV